MAQKLNCKSCSECIHLQKDDPIISGDMALYRCTNQMRGGRCVGWVQKNKPNSGLNTQGGVVVMCYIQAICLISKDISVKRQSVIYIVAGKKIKGFC